MKLFFVLAFMILSHFSHAQLQLRSIEDDVMEMNEGLNTEIYKYDINNNSLNYHIFFSDAESFKVYIHFNSAESIFDNKLTEMNSSGLLDQIIELGIREIKFLIKSEESGSILVSKNLVLRGFEAKIKSTIAGGNNGEGNET